MTDRDRLSRPRLVSLWRRVMPGATVLVTAQHRSGVATSVREWLADSDQRLVVWSSNRIEVPTDAPDADVVLLELEGMRDDHVTATLAVRERWPSATLIAVTSTQWPTALLENDVRPERVFAGSIFGFTADEAIDRAEQLGLALTWDEATALLDRLGTHAGFVDAVLRAAAARGALDDAAVRAGCDEQSAYFAGSAAAGVFRPNGWLAALVSARIGPMPRRTLLSVWGRDEVVRAALDNVLQSGFFVEDLERDTIELRRDLRIAFTARMEREAQIEQIDGIIADLAAQLLSSGRADDGWAIVADLPAARTRLLAQHWWLLGEIDVERARPWLAEAVLADPDPALRVALARTLVDVTSLNHTGAVSAADRREAAALLAEVGEPAGDLGIVAATLRGVLQRADGQFDEALRTHEMLADADGDDTSDPAHSLVRAGVLMQAGLSALDASRSDIAAARFSAAAALAHTAHDERLAQFAHDLLLIAAPGDVPLATSFQSRIDGIVGAQPISPSMRGIVAISSALYVVDPRALQDALDGTETTAIDDPQTLRFVTVMLRSMAHELLGTSSLALSRLELFEQELDGRQLTRNQQTLLAWARAEALLDAESGEHAIAVLDALPEAGAKVIPIDLLRARAYLRDDEPARALACLARRRRLAGIRGAGRVVASRAVPRLPRHRVRVVDRRRAAAPAGRDRRGLPLAPHDAVRHAGHERAQYDHLARRRARARCRGPSPRRRPRDHARRPAAGHPVDRCAQRTRAHGRRGAAVRRFHEGSRRAPARLAEHRQDAAALHLPQARRLVVGRRRIDRAPPRPGRVAGAQALARTTSSRSSRRFRAAGSPPTAPPAARRPSRRPGPGRAGGSWSAAATPTTRRESRRIR